MAYQAAMASAGALATFNPSSCSISLNIFANISHEIMIRHLITATKALWSKLGSIAPLYITYRTFGLLEG